MREALTRGEFKVTRAASDAARKTFALALVVALCALLTACPPVGGDLLPLAREDGASIVKTKFDGDTLALTREGLTMRARGLWSVADDAASVILEASNENTEALTLDFNRVEFAREDGRRLSLRSLSREKDSGGAEFLPDKAARIEGRQKATFTLEFAGDATASGGSADLLGRTATLRVPVELRAAPVEFVFGFKYAERRAQ